MRLCHVEVCVQPELQLAVLPLSDTDAQGFVEDACRESAECDAASGGSGSRWRNIPVRSGADNVVPSLSLALSLSLFLSLSTDAGNRNEPFHSSPSIILLFLFLSSPPLSALLPHASTRPINVCL